MESLEGIRWGADEQTGLEIIRRALRGPARLIAENGGYPGDVTVERILEGKGNFGFNAETGIFEDLVEAKVIDPAKVVRNTIQNAASIASLILTTEAIVFEPPKDKSEGKRKSSKQKKAQHASRI